MATTRIILETVIFFHHKYNGEKTVIFGHTETKTLHCEDDNCNVYFGKNHIIGIDGGAVYGGQLNCLELPNRKVYSVNSQDSLLNT